MAPWPQQTCPSCMPGLSAPLPLTRPAGEASGGLPPPAASQACRHLGAASPPRRGRRKRRQPRLRTQPARSSAWSALSEKQRTGSPQGDPPGEVMDRTGQPCSAPRCPVSRTVPREGAGGPVRGLAVPWNYRNRFLHATSDLFLEDFMSDALLGDSGSAVNFILTTMHVSEGGRE